MKLIVERKPLEFYERNDQGVPVKVKSLHRQVGLYIEELSEVPSSSEVIRLAGYKPEMVLPVRERNWSTIKIGDNYSYVIDYVRAYLVSEFSDEDLPDLNNEIILSSVEKYRDGKLIRTYDRLTTPTIYAGTNCKDLPELIMNHIEENIFDDYVENDNYEILKDGFKLTDNNVTYLVKFAKAFRVL